MQKSEGFKNKQKEAFYHLISKDIPDLISKSNETVLDNFKVEFSPLPINVDNYIRENSTLFVIVKANVCITNLTTKEQVEFIIDLLNLPVYHEQGFFIKGNYKQVLDLYIRTPGWSFTKTEKPAGTEYVGELNSAGSKYLAYRFDKRGFTEVRFAKGTSTTKKSPVSVSVFFRALTGLTDSELAQTFGTDNPFVVQAFTENKKGTHEAVNKYGKSLTRANCIEIVWNALFKTGDVKGQRGPRTVQLKLQDIETDLMSKMIFDLGYGNKDRLNNVQSCKQRALGKMLARDVKVGHRTFKAGTVLTEETCVTLDNLDIVELPVIFNDKIYILRKFSTFTFRALDMELAEDVPELDLKAGIKLKQEHLDVLNDSNLTTLVVIDSLNNRRVLTRRTEARTICRDDLFAAFTIFLDNLNGYDSYDRIYELTNRVSSPYESKVLEFIQKNIETVTYNVVKNLNKLDLTESLMSVTDEVWKNLDKDLFISLVASTEEIESQRADMINAISNISKSYKVVSDLPAKASSPDAVRVQDTQLGRLDPMDSPESSKIGLVHTRTVLAGEDENDFLTTPYLKVNNGEIESMEPVYLNATEETGKFIAEWCEDFKEINDDDGKEVKKKRVKVRQNGNILSAPLEKVTLMEYSVLQVMAPARTLIPFQNHDAPKRVLMAINHQKQANKTVKSQRPLVGAGGESILDLGCYTAEDALKRFYANNVIVYPELKSLEKDVMESTIRLIDTFVDGNIKILKFDIDFLKSLENSKIPTQCEMIIPYHMPNDEKTIYTFEINSKTAGVYKGKDIVAHYSGIDIDEHNVIVNADFGALKFGDDVFSKGLGLGVNLRIGFKTYQGSTNDDSFVISSELVYDDTLTTFNVIKVTKELFNTDLETEVFGRTAKVNSNPYIGPDGLPAIGTMLKPGDAFVSFIKTKRGKSRTEFDFLDTYEEGQVVRASIEEKDKKRYALIYLASRSSAEQGDKMSGRHGNKGVIGKIVPMENMPFDPITGERLHIMMSPLGLPSRMNLGLLLEALYAVSVRASGKNTISIVSPYLKDDYKIVKALADQHGIKPKKLVDGRTGHEFERLINVGELYMYMLIHKAKKKIHSIGFNAPVDQVTLQPKKGAKREGGQAFGEMEAWCLQGIGANKVLQDIYSFMSDDFEGGKFVHQSLKSNPHSLHFDGVNNNNFPIQALMRCMGVDLVTDEDEDCYEFKPLSDDIIRKLAVRPVTREKELHSSAIFGDNTGSEEKAKNRNRWGWLELNTKIIHPLWIRRAGIAHYITNFELGKEEEPTPRIMTSAMLDDIAKGLFYVDTSEDTAMEQALQEYYRMCSEDDLPIDEEEVKAIQARSFKGATLTIYAGSEEYTGGRRTARNESIIDLNMASEKLYEGMLYENDEDNDVEFEADFVKVGMEKDSQAINKKYLCVNELTDEHKEKCITGMKALIWIFENYNVENTLNLLNATKLNRDEKNYDALGDLATFEEESYHDLLKQIRFVEDFITRGSKLSDYVISTYPIIPQIYRPDMSGLGMREIPDFDWYYINILHEVNKFKITPSDANAYAIYKAIADYCGILSEKEITRKSKYQNLLNWFTGKGKEDKGKIRKAQQSKKVKCSGRTVIIPMEDTSWDPIYLGVPYSICLKIYQSGITGYLIEKLSNGTTNEDLIAIKDGLWEQMFTTLSTYNKASFKKIYTKTFRKFMGEALGGNASVDTAYFTFNKWIKEYVEGDKELGLEPQVVLCGRQPSLHRFSIRAYFVKIVHSKAIHIHPLVCKGYNADFDGDAMWLMAVLTDESKEEAMRLMSPRNHYINPKNSSVILEVSQDIVLGLYASTMLKNNAIVLEDDAIDSVYFYNSVERLKVDIEDMRRSTYDLVCLSHSNGNSYLSTAGRIVFNSLIHNGFTDKEFTNTLGIQGINPKNYKELRYDALLSSGEYDASKFRYQKISEVMKTLYKELGSDAISNFSKVTAYGFMCSDIHSVTLAYEDFELQSNREEILAGAEITKAKIEDHYLHGLISAKDKKNALISLYKKEIDKDEVKKIKHKVSKINTQAKEGLITEAERKEQVTLVFSELKGGINDFIKAEVVGAMDRNNNLFIMMDSGARGSKGQVMQACGAIGVLQKTQTENLETSVTSNYFTGITSFDTHLISYSTRTAVASTQNETQDAGAATRSAVYMESGLSIVEEDCHKEKWWYEIKWDKRREELDLLIPSEKWIAQHLVGNKLDEKDVETYELLKDCVDENGLITMDSFKVLSKGFHSLNILKKTINGEYDKFNITIDPESMIGAKFKATEENVKLFKYISKNNTITPHVVEVLMRNKVKSFETSLGTFSFRYAIDKGCASQLMYREARNLPSLECTTSKTYPGVKFNIITPDTLKYISNNGIEFIEARIFLDCKSKHGICAHCYGPEYTTADLPPIGAVVGIEAAQSIGEPSAQLTMNLVHALGAAGSSVSNGVKDFSSALNGTPNKNKAILAPTNGYLRVRKLDSNVAIMIEVENKGCANCMACMIKAGTDCCPIEHNKKALEKGDSLKQCLCEVKDKIRQKSLLIKDGEWVNQGDQLTELPVDPDKVTADKGDTDMEKVIRRKQQIWLNYYYKTFSSNNIEINARQFECLVRVQNFLVFITKSSDPNFKEGSLYEFTEVIDNPNVKFVSQLSGKNDVFLNYGGAMVLLSHSNFAQHLAKLTIRGHKSYRQQSKSPIGKIGIGEVLDKDEIKDIASGTVVDVVTESYDSDDLQMDEISIIKDDTYNVDDMSTGFKIDLSDMNFNLDNLDLDVIEDDEEEIVEEIVEMDIFDDRVITSETEEEEYNNTESEEEEVDTKSTEKLSNMSIF